MQKNWAASYKDVVENGQPLGLLTRKHYHSHKLKRSAMNTQVCIDFSGWVNFVSSSKPAGHWNDPKQMKEEAQQLLDVSSFLALLTCCWKGSRPKRLYCN